MGLGALGLGLWALGFVFCRTRDWYQEQSTKAKGQSPKAKRHEGHPLNNHEPLQIFVAGNVLSPGGKIDPLVWHTRGRSVRRRPVRRVLYRPAGLSTRRCLPNHVYSRSRCLDGNVSLCADGDLRRYWLGL